ncbi:hypothetical protein [Lentzea sp. NPDC092896]|uniref:hypothetical protein n=1 Tax=Lentzea sp. NPDC092896 TaxID=3364127 RepID=UPI0037F49387
MITEQALIQVLEAAQQAEDEGPCFCLEPDCEEPHADDEEPATHVSTFVTSTGQVDTRLNKQYLGPDWGYDGDLETVTDPALWPAGSNAIVVERATGAWCALDDYL